MKIETFEFTPMEFTDNLNQLKDILIEELETEGMLDKNCNVQDLKDRCLVLLCRKGWFGRAWDRFLSKNPSAITIRVVFFETPHCPLCW